MLAKRDVATLSFRCTRFFSTTARALPMWRSELRSSFWRFGEGGCNGTMAPFPTSPMPSMCGNAFDNNNNANNNNHHNNTNN